MSENVERRLLGFPFSFYQAYSVKLSKNNPVALASDWFDDVHPFSDQASATRMFDAIKTYCNQWAISVLLDTATAQTFSALLVQVESQPAGTSGTSGIVASTPVDITTALSNSNGYSEVFSGIANRPFRFKVSDSKGPSAVSGSPSLILEVKGFCTNLGPLFNYLDLALNGKMTPLQIERVRPEDMGDAPMVFPVDELCFEPKIRRVI